jgi:cobalt-zinc-cadmium resistance protein CzcA
MSGVLYLSEINRRRRAPGVALRQAVIEGSRVQLRPVLMVVMVAALGMVPAMVAQGIGSDIQRPLATVVVGGLASTLILTPLALPAVFWLGERLRSRGASRDRIR